MKTRQALFRMLTFCTFASITASSRQAHARACAEPSDCPRGWYCDNSDAGVAADGGPGGTCMSLPCQSNSDCGPGLSCFVDGWSLGPGLHLRGGYHVHRGFMEQLCGATDDGMQRRFGLPVDVDLRM